MQMDIVDVQPSSSGGEKQSIQRKKHHRRAKKRKIPREYSGDHPTAKSNSRSGPEDALTTALQPVLSSEPKPLIPVNVVKSESKRGCRKRHRRHGQEVRPDSGGRRPNSKGKRSSFVLRPTIGPLLNAPKNSTQYIIEDHVKGGDCDADNFDSDPNDGGKGLMSESWIYFEKDFQTVYESAHREEVGEWDRSKLIKEISNLEKRQKELIALLSRLEPEVYLQRLRSRASNMLERNASLKNQLKVEKPSTLTCDASPSSSKDCSDGSG